MDGLVELLDEQVHVVASPVAAVLDAVGVLLILGIIGDREASHRIGIEIVVHVDAVDVVAADDVACHLADVVAVLGNAGVENLQAVVLEAALRMLHHHMIDGERRGALGLCPIGINPGVKLHAACVALVNHPLQRVPVGLRRLALLPREDAAPRLQRAGVEGVALGPHLEDDGIHAILLQLVELEGQRLLHGLRRQALELSVHTLNPCSPELSFGLLCTDGRRQCQQQCCQCNQSFHFRY